jgi:transposase
MSHRAVVNAVLWRTRTCSPWRDLPPEYGNWKTIYNRHRRWSADGTWSATLNRLRVDADRSATEGGQWVVGIDATVVRAHAHAAGARHGPPADIHADRLISVLDEIVSAQDTGGGVE